MTWTIYRLDNGEMIFNGWPGEDHPSETGFDFDPVTMGAVQNTAGQIALQEWNPVALEWSYSVQIARGIKWAAAKEFYEQRCASGFPLPGIGTVQTDTASREAIQFLFEEASEQIEGGNPGWTTQFKNLANEYVTVTALDVIEVRRALRAFLGACFNAKSNIEAALNAATTVEEIHIIDVEEGYP